MRAFDIYKIYLAAKLHFTHEKYDLFVHNGRVRSCSEEEFSQKPLSSKFRALEYKVKTPQEAAQHFVACFAYDADVFNPIESEEAHSKWKKHKEMMTQLILDDLDLIGDVKLSLGGSPCKLQQLISGNQIKIETAVALNKFFHFTKEWKNDFTYKHLGVKIEKLNRFIKFNENKVYEAIKFNEQTT